MSDSVRSHRQQPTRLLHPWDSPGKNTGVGCHFLLQCMKVKSLSCVQLSDPMDCSLSGSSVHGIFQARVLEWVAIAFSVSCMSCLYVLEISPLSVVSFAIIFSHSESCLFTLLIVSFTVQKLLSFVPFVCFCLYFHYSRKWVIEDASVIYVRECFAYVFL